MQIPAKLQVFQETEPVVISDRDAERLLPSLSGWPSLHARFTEGVTETDLKRLIILELMGDRREMIVYRLLARLGRVQQDRLWDKISRAVTLVPQKERT